MQGPSAHCRAVCPLQGRHYTAKAVCSLQGRLLSAGLSAQCKGVCSVQGRLLNAGPVKTVSSKPHQKTTFIKNQFNRKPISSETLSSEPLSSETTFIKIQFHQKPFSSQILLTEERIKHSWGAKSNIVRISVKTSPAEGRRRFDRNTAYARLLGFTRSSCAA